MLELDSVALCGSSLNSPCGHEASYLQGGVGLAASVLLSSEGSTGLLHLLGEEAHLSLKNICTMSEALPSASGVSRKRGGLCSAKPKSRMEADHGRPVQSPGAQHSLADEQGSLRKQFMF